MSGSAFAVTHHAFSSGAGRTSDGNGSHASTLKSPSYTKSVSWQHYQFSLCLKMEGEEQLCDCVNELKHGLSGNDSNLLIVFYVQIMPDDLVMQLHRF
ncbi:alpha-mannosidase [Shigella flexneri]|nr:putative alpha-mannosidase [Shigella flexneri 2002017]ASQ55361.1 alpha-mannosidase [Shigella flexneri 4c]ASQ64635.1 alpha-mannosidase [Shigella flexneri 1a]POR96517.1 alpha-mannosidase [Shigella flexneri]ASQ59170.1 alpha-mannosidase [Shigella flexneri 4c]